MNALACMRITVVYAPAPRQVFERTVELPAGARVGDVFAASGLREAFPEVPGRGGSAGFGVWGRKADAEQFLQDGDRVEIYRPLWSTRKSPGASVSRGRARAPRACLQRNAPAPRPVTDAS
jgi:putative ubiquitin-RnfH superfamily antitoxin RatB of RatAB toxin-antitoxin module